MSRGDRREKREKAIKHAEKLMRDLGPNGGLVYEKHIDKIEESSGYYEGGSISHYINTNRRIHTRSKNTYGGERWSRHDTQLGLEKKKYKDNFDEDLADWLEGETDDGICDK